VVGFVLFEGFGWSCRKWRKWWRGRHCRRSLSVDTQKSGILVRIKICLDESQ
jgi:hypothetical protein